VHAFVKRRDTFTQFDFPGGHDTVPVAINNRDEIVGLFTDAVGLTHAFTLRRGVFTQFDPPGTVGFSAAFGINAQGFIVGSFTDADGNFHGYFDRQGVFTQLDFPRRYLDRRQWH